MAVNRVRGNSTISGRFGEDLRYGVLYSSCLYQAERKFVALWVPRNPRFSAFEVHFHLISRDACRYRVCVPLWRWRASRIYTRPPTRLPLHHLPASLRLSVTYPLRSRPQHTSVALRSLISFTIIHMNPYAQAGWSNPANPHSVNDRPWTPNAPAQPSIFGALPFAQPGSPQQFHSFTFTSLRPNILNSTVLGPRDKMYIAVVTDQPKPGFTLLHLADGKAFGVIQWGQRTIVEVRDIVRKQFAGDFLKLTGDGT